MLYQSSGDTLFSTEKEGITTRPWLWKGTYLSQLQDTTHPAITRGDPLVMLHTSVCGLVWNVWHISGNKSRTFMFGSGFYIAHANFC